MKADLSERLTTLKIDIPETVTVRQLQLIRTELVAAPRPAPARRRRASRYIAIMSAVFFTILPVGAGIAAETAVPGDALYPVKRTTEWVRGWFDDSLAANHRIDELEAVLDRQEDAEVVSDRLRDAEVAVSDRPGNVRLTDRLDQARDRFERDYLPSHARADDDRLPDEAPTDSVPTDRAPSDSAPTDESPSDSVAPDPPPDDSAPRDEPTTTTSRPPSDTTPTTSPPGDGRDGGGDSRP